MKTSYRGLHSGEACDRRGFLASVAAAAVAGKSAIAAERAKTPTRIAITLDLEMSRNYPTRDKTEWDFQKGNLDEATKQYALNAGKLVADRGAKIHFFCVGRVLEQQDVRWLAELAEMGHAIGNHTYDHVNVWATAPEQTQFRFQRSPWLVANQSAEQIIRENIRVTTKALKHRLSIDANGFRTPGGSYAGLNDRKDLQQMLLAEGFSWVSSVYPPHESGEPHMPPGEDVYASIVAAQQKSQPFVYPTGLVEIPMSPISDVTGFRSKFWKLEYFLKAVRLAVNWAIEQGTVFDFLAHPSCLVVEDPEMRTIQQICDLVREAGDRAQIVTLDTIAKSMAGVPR